MSSEQAVSAWIDRYVVAWNSNAPADIGALFTEDAVYFTAPFREPWRGRDEIVREWIERRDEPGETSFDWHPVVVTREVAVVQGTTRYPDETFSNLWVIRLDDDGRAREFTEWFMEHPGRSVAE